jgi:hypothetical protein
MPTAADTGVCAYCGETVLDGSETVEHPIPAALNSRWTTRAVCDACNSWAGRYVDTPFLGDPVVRDLRFSHRIRDRAGRLVVHDSPLLTGTTAEGQRVTMQRDGTPRAHPVVREQDGEVRIIASSETELAAIFGKLRARAERDGKRLELGTAETRQERPAIEGRVCVSPGAWERMAAKVVLGVASKALPVTWRRSAAAAALRERLHDLERRRDDVRLRQPPDVVALLAPAPSSLVSMRGGRDDAGQAIVSLLGTFAFAFELGPLVEPLDFVWVGDPVRRANSAEGPLGHVAAARVSGY